MTDPLAELQAMAAGMRDLNEQAAELADSRYIAADEAGTVEVTLNGHGHLIDLQLHDRLLSLGAEEVAERIRDVHAAATGLIEETYVQASTELEDQARQIIARGDAQVQTRRCSE